MNLTNEFQGAVEASRSLCAISQQKIDSVLRSVAKAAVAKSDFIIEANRKDLVQMSTENPMYDRLLLTAERIQAIANDLLSVAELHSPVGEVLSETVRPNGMKITKIRVPFGVVGVIYEARPNVSFDVFGLCFKTANACVLKGGRDAQYSNDAIAAVIRSVLRAEGVDERAVTLLPADREATAELLGAVGYVDLLIPRGSSSLIKYVRDNARIPVIETGAGICHTYIDADADVQKAMRIVFNAKTRRVSVCNALDCVIVHSQQLANLPLICAELASKSVIIYADECSYAVLDGMYPVDLLCRSDTDSYGTEFLDYKMSIKSVDTFDQALDHITRYSSKHSETIVTENRETSRVFLQMVDAACVYANVSTSFTDGAQFGFGAEIGISTQKLHARGPMALPELTSYKYLIEGDGQTRQ